MISRRLNKIVSGFILTVYILGNVATSYCVTNSAPSLRDPISQKIKLEGDISISTKNPKISLSLRDADVPQVLRMFADKAGLNIVFHPSVFHPENYKGVAVKDDNNNNNNFNNNNLNNIDSINGNNNGIANNANVNGNNNNNGNNNARRNSSNNINNSNRKEVIIPVSLKATLDLVQVPLNEAFKMVLKISGLTYFMEGKTIFVLSQQAAKTSGVVNRELRTIPVKYVDAVGLARFLNHDIFSKDQTGISGGQVAVTNTSTNEIIIIGTENDYLLAKKIVDQFDKKPLEESFILNHTTPREMAYLLCNMVFKNLKLMQDEEDDEREENKDETNDDSKKSEDEKNIAQNIRLKEGDLTGERELNDMVLGRGLIACQYNNRVKTDNVQSLHTGGVTVAYFATKGTVLVRGVSAEQLKEVEAFIKDKDTKQLQALIEVSILELNEKGSKEFYNTWNLYSNFLTAQFDAKSGGFSNSVGGYTYPVMVFGGKDNPIGTALSPRAKYIGTPQLQYTFDYLISSGKIRLLANPKVLVTNGEKSLIDLSSDYIKSTKQELVQQTGTTGAIANNKTYNIADDKGIKVELSPFISRDGYVTLNIKPQYSTVAETITSTDPLTHEKIIDATLLQRRNLDLRGIRLKDGDTLVIGGMITEDEDKKVWKIPFLGDIPGIGTFFRSTATTKEKKELVIMLTPRIIDDKEEIVNKGNATL